MKSIIKLMTVVALCAALAACGEKNKGGEEPAGKPVITPDMFSVNANSETGVVVFQFLDANLNPFWTVKDPNNETMTFTDRNVTKTFEAKGPYSGTLVAYGAAGQSDPAEFNFVIGNGSWDSDLSYIENMLMANTWRPYFLGWKGGEGEESWNSVDRAPGYLFDDRVVFKKGGVIEWNQAETKTIYDDRVGGVEYSFTGSEKWAYVKEGDKEYLQFSNGGFPGILADEASKNGKYLITDVTATSVTLNYYVVQEEPYWLYVTLAPEDWVAPDPSINTDVTVDEAKAALSGKKFKISELGWWGGTPGGEDYWEYFTVASEGELPAYMNNDYIIFNANGSLVYELAMDEIVKEGEDPKSGHFIYNDAGLVDYTATGSEKWSVITDGGATTVQFADGGFPLAIAGNAAVASTEPEYWFGQSGKWLVMSIDTDGTVRLDIYQSFNGQYVSVSLTPVAE